MPPDVGEHDVRLDDLRAQRHARDPGQSGAQLPRAAVVVADPVEHRVERHEPGRRSDAGPVEARATEAVRHLAHPADDRLAAGEHGAERRRQALVERQDDGVRRPGEVGEGNPERDGRIHEPGAVDVDAAVVPLRGRRERFRLPGGEGRATRPRMRVLEHEQRRMALGDQLLGLDGIHPSVRGEERGGPQPRDLLDPVRLGGENVRGGLEHDVLPGPQNVSIAARFAIPHVGIQVAAGLPSSAATRSQSSFTDASSPTVAQPSSARRIASHISSVGTEQRSERRSIIGAANVGPAGHPCARRRRPRLSR